MCVVIKEKANINELSIPLKKLEKEEENNCPPKKWMNEDTEINEKEKQSIQRVNKTNILLFEK